MNRTLSILFASISLWSCTGGSTPDGGMVLCPPQDGAGTTHSTTITASETWGPDNGPHVLTANVSVASGATLTIEPCTRVRLKKDVNLVVEGNLVAEAKDLFEAIRFDAADAEPWAYLQVTAPGTIKLAFVVVEGGGSETGNNYAMIEARGDQLLPAQEVLKLDHVAVNDSASYGVSLRGSGAFTKDSRDVTITRSKKASMRILPRLATNVPTGVYAGNAENAILIETEAYGDVNVEDVTLRNRGTPYRVGETTLGHLIVGPKPFRLTIEAGVKLMFKKAGSLEVDATTSPTTTGVLVANGTAAQPVVFTSSAAVPAAGDWRGLVIGEHPDTAIKLDHIEIRYAGGPSMANGFHCEPNPTVPGAVSSNEDAALSIFHQPASALLTNSTIADSKGVGVNLGYTGTYVDFTPTNTFIGNASCKVSYPRPSVGQCPTPVPCEL